MIYTRSKLRGKILTVQGLICNDRIGITLAHEHCLIDYSCVFSAPKASSIEKIAYQPLSFKNVGYVRYHMSDNRDNLIMLDEKQAIKELLLFKRAGGKTLGDVTNIGIGRDPIALRRIAKATGLNIIMGSGYYIKATQKVEVLQKRTEEGMAQEIIDDVFKGVGGSNIHSGLIGEIGCSWPLEDFEKRALRAGAIAQKETGAPLFIHPGRNEKAPAEIVKIIKDAGADLSRTVICHIDRTLFEAKSRYKLAETGCYLAYDEWGSEGYYPDSFSVIDILNDTQRIQQIKDLVARGFKRQVIISHDICQKCRYMRYGGHGYTHILYNAMPAARKRGISERDIDQFLVKNPRQLFTFK